MRPACQRRTNAGHLQRLMLPYYQSSLTLLINNFNCRDSSVSTRRAWRWSADGDLDRAPGSCHDGQAAHDDCGGRRAQRAMAGTASVQVRVWPPGKGRAARGLSRTDAEQRVAVLQDAAPIQAHVRWLPRSMPAHRVGTMVMSIVWADGALPVTISDSLARVRASSRSALKDPTVDRDGCPPRRPAGFHGLRRRDFGILATLCPKCVE
jgi:hypothetical protein